MKRVLFIFSILLSIQAEAQYSNFIETSSSIKIGAGYTHDFPGLNGYTITGEVTFPFAPHFEGGIGLKKIDLSGTPRTSQVQEYTKANTLDFNLYYVPIHTEIHTLRFGLGYAFSAYKIRRSYPVFPNTASEKPTSWPIQYTKSRTSGVNILAEYEYELPSSPLSLGLRAALYKAYDRVSFVGAYVAYRL